MSRKPKKGYFVRGQFVAEGSELDLELKRDLKGGDEPSKTELKAQSTELQGLGEDLLGLRSDLGIPDKLAALGVGADRIDELAEAAVADPSTGGNPVELTVDAARKLLIESI